MNIVHYLKRMWLADGGVVRAVLDLCSALSGRGHDVTLMSSDFLDVPPTWMDETPGLPKTERIGRIVGRLSPLNREATRRAREVIARADVAPVARRDGVGREMSKRERRASGSRLPRGVPGTARSGAGVHEDIEPFAIEH